MSDTGLAPFAKMIARNPPLNVWKTHTDGVPDYAALNAVLSAALEDLAANPGNPQTMSELYEKKAGTICDVTAYSMMVIGAGLERVKALRGRVSRWGTKDGDRVRRYKQSDGSTVGAELLQWTKVKAPGVLQFKFDATGGTHTFAVERLILGEEIRFRIYQSYEGLYRLSDFLGLTEGGDYLRTMCKMQIIGSQWPEKIYGSFTAEQTNPNRAKKKENILKTIDRQVAQRVALLNGTRNSIGAFKELNREDLFLNVITPLRSMLDGGVTGAEYETLAGHGADGRVFCNTLLVAYSSEIDPQRYEANYQALLACEGMLAGWLDPTLS
ncbi:MAG: hypothetical protein AAFN78_17290 [Pseudomonadota bacterium]